MNIVNVTLPPKWQFKIALHLRVQVDSIYRLGSKKCIKYAKHYKYLHNIGAMVLTQPRIRTTSIATSNNIIIIKGKYCMK